MKQNKEQLYREIAELLKYEKEIYGDWDLTLPNPDKKTRQEPDSKRQEISGTGQSKSAKIISNSDSKRDSPVRAEEIGAEHKASQSQSREGKDGTDEPTGPTQDSLSTPEQCRTLEQLKSLCETADQLKTDLKGTNLVFGVGDPDADLMIVGEAPGYHEDKQGEPFVGKAGQLLDKILAAIDFSREDVYITNILKHRPPDNRDPSGLERTRSLPFLLRQIELIDPEIILCLGRVAATTLLDRNDSLGRMRGTFHPFMQRELTVTYHPAALLRNPKWKRPVWEDVQLVKKRYDELTN